MKDHPEAAEAATEVGVDDGPEALGRAVLLGVAVVVVIGMLAFLVGYLS